MEVISGKKGSDVYIYNDYTYNIDNRSDAYIYRCNTRKSTNCRGSIILHEDNSIEIVREHNHPKSPETVARHKMKKEMLKLSRETCMGLKEIFDSVCRSNPSAGEYLSFPTLRSTLHRERTMSRPLVPDTLKSLCDTLKNFDIIKNIYKGSVITSNQKAAIILSTTDLLEGLTSATELYVDGTFSVLPRKPHIAQLYSIHIRYMDTGIGTLFVLCDERTTTFYDALWDEILQLAPQLKQNVNFIMSDYEMAAIKSLSNKFPNAKLSGCWFHFNQAVLRKWRKLRLSNAPQTVLSMTMTLPLLPSDMFQEALLIIQAEADLLSREYPNVLQFMSYLRLTWANMASKISTYNCPIRTNNIVESFHNIAAQKLGIRNINIWTFLEKLKNLITDQELDFRRSKNGIRARKARTRANKDRDSKIINAQKDLIDKRLPLKHFLLMFNKDNNIFQLEHLASFNDEEISNDDQIADVTFFADDINVPIEEKNKNKVRRRRSHRNKSRTSLCNALEKESDSESGIDKGTGNFCVDEQSSLTSTNTQMQAGQFEEPRPSYDTSNLENGDIYEVPDDDYGYLHSNNDGEQRELPFHNINWNLQDVRNESKGKFPEEICALCLSNERTYIFIPCGHLVCCNECIERFKDNRCPICHVVYEKYLQIRRP